MDGGEASEAGVSWPARRRGNAAQQSVSDPGPACVGRRLACKDRDGLQLLTDAMSGRRVGYFWPCRRGTK